MVFRWLFPSSGGGTARRWFKYRQDIFIKANFEPDVTKNSPFTLFDFQRHDDAVDASVAMDGGKISRHVWRLSDDSVIGGFSKGSIDMIRTKEDYKRYLAGQKLEDTLAVLDVKNDEDKENLDVKDDEDKENNDEGQTVENNSKDDIYADGSPDTFRPFLRWKGHTNTKIGARSDAQRSGFCYLRSPDFPFGGANLRGLYNALEVVCRSDGRMYTINMKVETFIPEDVYQAVIAVPPTHPDRNTVCKDTGGHFDRIILPFREFIVTGAGGKPRAVQRELDNKVEVEHIGFTLMDGQDGDFQFDIARVRAVYYDGRKILGPKKPWGHTGKHF